MLLSGNFIVSGGGELFVLVDNLSNETTHPPGTEAVFVNGGLVGTPPLGTVVQVDGSSGDDRITTQTSGGGDFILNGGDGNDTLISDSAGIGDQNVQMFGGAGDDTFENQDHDDHDSFNGGPGIDTIKLDSTTTSIDGGMSLPDDIENVVGVARGNVEIDGNALNNYIDVTIQGDGELEVFGGAGNDTLISGRYDDATLRGEAGDDLLIGSEGKDHFFGGTGVDTIDYSARTANLKIYLDGSQPSGAAGEGDTFDNTIDRVLAGAGNDLIVGSSRNEALYGNAGNDSIFGAGGNDNLYGGEGNDLLDGGTGADKFDGGPGTDIADYHTRTANLVVWLDGSHSSGQASENDKFNGTVEIVYGGSGNDYLVGTKYNNALYGNAGNDSIFGGGGIDAFFGGAGNDQIHAKNGNKDYVDGGPGEKDSAQTDIIDTVVNVETVTH